MNIREDSPGSRRPDRRFPSRFLRSVGQYAVIEPDELVPGAFILSVGGAQQSHVNLDHPQEISYEYLRRIAHLADLAAPAGAPIRALHLGAGALTLARYIGLTRPGSPQCAVEIERGLLDFVLQHLPLPAGTDLETRIADARDELRNLPPESFDLVVLDVFAGPESPEHLTDVGFYLEAAALVAPTGILAVNVGDDPGLAFTAGQLRAMRTALYEVAALAPTSIFTGRYPGNIVLAGTRMPWPTEWTAALAAVGPHPASVLTGVELDDLARR